MVKETEFDYCGRKFCLVDGYQTSEYIRILEVHTKSKKRLFRKPKTYTTYKMVGIVSIRDIDSLSDEKFRERIIGAIKNRIKKDEKADEILMKKNSLNRISMKVTDNHVFFWRGVFSQWHMSKFIVDGIEYNCAEQYIMHKKALMFGYSETAEKIMAFKRPKEQLALCREVKNDDEKWSVVRFDVVCEGNMAKYSQNELLKESMLNIGSRLFVEASQYDGVWGVRLEESDPRIDDPANWDGQNLLGKVLIKARDELKNN